jgi:hypothetical protein
MEISEGFSASTFTTQVVEEDLNRQNCSGKIQTLELLAVREDFNLQPSEYFIWPLLVADSKTGP